jgi:uncharacterized protein (DUF362 family)
MVVAKAKVAILRTTPETVINDYARLFDLAGVSSALQPDASTIIKDNISWHFPMPSANTTPWQLEATILALRSAGYADLACVQNKTVVIDTHKGEDLNGYLPIFKHYQIPVLYNFKPGDMKWIHFKPKARMLALDRVFPEGLQIPDYFVGKNVVHLPTVKCHIYTTTTGAMKNAFGGLLNTHRHYTHSWIHETLVDLLAIQKEIHTGLFAVMDGTTAGNGPGPRTLIPVVKNVILGSADQVAIDAVAAKMMGFDPLTIDYIRLAQEQGLGVGDPREIEVLGDVDAASESWGFRVGMNFHRLLGWLSWYGPTRFLQKLLFRSPLVALPIFVSEFNHDYVHWPLKEKHVYERWRRDTAWGQLFQRYEREGYLGG